MSLGVITRNNYLVFAEELFGGEKSTLFDEKGMALNYAREWLKEKDFEVSVCVATFAIKDDGTFRRIE